MGISSCIPVFASEISPRLVSSGKCPSGALVPHTSYSAWGTVDQRICVHKPYGVDIELVRRKAVDYICNSCGSFAYADLTEETKWECHGINKP